MSTDKETLQHVEQLAIAAANNLVTDYETAMVPDGMRIEDLEIFQENRNRYRAIFDTNHIEDFAKYFKAHNGKSCFINQEDMQAKSIFDLGTVEEPLHCRHRAKLVLVKTAAYKALLSVANPDSHRHDFMSQKQLAEWIEDWQDFIVVKDEEHNVIPMGKAVSAIRRVTIEATAKQETNTQTFSSNKSTLESISASSDDDPLPGFIMFTCIPYHGLSEFDFLARISLITGKEPQFSLKVTQLEQTQEEMADDFKNKLSDKLGKDAKLFIGTIAV